MSQQLPWREEVVPVRPAACSDRFIGFFTIQGHRLRGNETLALPAGKSFAQQFEHSCFTGEIRVVGSRVTAPSMPRS